jgi:hypothetical protein
MTTTVISFALDTTSANARLGFEAWINDRKFFDCDHVTDPETVSVEIDAAAADHELRLILKNKQAEHTQIDEAGNIVKDNCLTVSRLNFDKIELKQIFIDQATYTHNRNNTGDPITDKFYGQMGCNGTVSLKFSTPIYLWLLEHM